ncbi:hypothetical protein FHW58_004758 [Duganella sp. 1224]|uniref:hypothetical protein n=1 Tax=Duganella sp. 1224 TaxID=2587052 RepID=UPI0015CD1392|nr:hypothetical protein [Duganella sp. 1224]NYE63528.1 hypothetical protein [Duganella sp. 1224]
MNEQISERVGTLETDVAVIQSNYVRRDEFADLRTEMCVGFATTAAKIDMLREESNGRIDRQTATLLKWMLASQLSVAGLFIAAIKYL